MLMKQISANQSGVLLFGPGGCRLDSVQSGLTSLTTEQFELVSRAKKYASEQSVKHISNKPVAAIVVSQQQQQKSMQKYQALVLMCRLYVGSVSSEVREDTIQAAFSPFGTVKSVSMSWDPITMKHKGFAFVEYELPEAAQLALDHMNAVQLGGRQLKVGRPSNLPQAEPVVKQIQEECKQYHRIYVSNVHPNVNEQDLAELFEPFGTIRSCKLAMTPGAELAQHRGCGFIEFGSESAATEAQAMNGHLNLGGTVLHVCKATTPVANITIYGTLEPAVTTSLSNADSVAVEEVQSRPERTSNSEQQASTTTNNSHAIKQSSLTSNGVHSSTPGVIVLKNMITSDDEIDDSLHLDVHLECSKHGKVSQVVIYVDKNVRQLDSNSGADSGEQEAVYKDEIKIFVKYYDSVSSSRALAALNGRFFAGRKVSAEQYDLHLFRQHIYTQ